MPGVLRHPSSPGFKAAQNRRSRTGTTSRRSHTLHHLHRTRGDECRPRPAVCSGDHDRGSALATVRSTPFTGRGSVATLVAGPSSTWSTSPSPHAPATKAQASADLCPGLDTDRCSPGLRGRFRPMFHPEMGCSVVFFGSRQAMVFSPVRRRVMRLVMATWIRATERVGRVS